MHCCRAFPLRWLGFLVRDILSICQMHILLSRTAQISLELHFCVELHTKKALMSGVSRPGTESSPGETPGFHHIVA